MWESPLTSVTIRDFIQLGSSSNTCLQSLCEDLMQKWRQTPKLSTCSFENILRSFAFKKV